MDKMNMSSRSDAVKEIILRKGGFLSTWALLVIFGLVSVLLFCTWFIRYPDIIQTNATLTAKNAAKQINIRQSGRLVRLFVESGDSVGERQIIGWIESIADHHEVIGVAQLLDQCLDLMYEDRTGQISSLFAARFRHLGELQPAYQQFLLDFQKFNDYLFNGYYQKRRLILNQNLKYLQEIGRSLEEEENYLEQDLTLSRESYTTNDSLYRDKVLSRQDMRNERSKLLGKQMSLPQVKASLFTNAKEQADKQSEIDDLDHTMSQQKIIFQQVLQTFKSTVDDWLQKYTITAPVSGKVVFISPLQENQLLQAGKLVGFINPVDSRYYAQVNIPQNNFGKVEPGQRVQLRFDAYPYPEFGFVEGRLAAISGVPSDSGFLATVELPNGLVTSHKKLIQYHDGLRSRALIIVKDLRLLSRLYYNLVNGAQR